MFRRGEAASSLLIIEPGVVSSSLTQITAGAEGPCPHAGTKRPVSV